MDLDLKGKKVFISGSTQGIGLACAQAFLQEGCFVIFNGRNPDTFASIQKNLLPQYENSFSFIKGDVSDLQVVVDMKKNTDGPIDHLVCNVGSGRSSAPGSETQADLKNMLDINFYAATNCIEVFKDDIIKNRGSITCISSICGHAALGAPLGYNAAKGALNHYITGLARALGPHGVRANIVSPGNIIFEGSVWEKKLSDSKAKVEAMLENEVSLKRLGRPEEIGQVVCFLASARASFITGAKIIADGGQLRV